MVLMDGIVQLYSVCISGRMVFRLTVQCIEVVTPYNDQFNTKHHMIAMLDLPFYLLVYGVNVWMDGVVFYVQM